MNDVNQTVADTAAKMWNDNYGRERSLQVMAPGLIQQGQGINENAIRQILTAGDMQRQFGDWENQNQQAAFEDSLNRYWRPVNPYASIISGSGSMGGSSSSSSTGPSSSALAGGLTGALGGGAMGGMLAGASGGAIGGPLGIGIGALLGGLAGAIR